MLKNEPPYGEAFYDANEGGPYRSASVILRLALPILRPKSVLDVMFAAVSDGADLEWLMIDSTTIRAHQQAAGARKVKGGLSPRVSADPAAA